MSGQTIPSDNGSIEIDSNVYSPATPKKTTFSDNSLKESSETPNLIKKSSAISENSPVPAVIKQSLNISVLNGDSSPPPMSGRKSPLPKGTTTSVSSSEKVSPRSTISKNSPLTSIRNAFNNRGTPRRGRKNDSLLSECISTAPTQDSSHQTDKKLQFLQISPTASHSRGSSPLLDRKLQFLQNMSFFSRTPEASPNAARKAQSKGSGERDSYHHVTPSYSYLSDQLRRVSAGSFQCAVFCGGQNCKYEGSSHWKENEMAIKGLYSHWITDSILAMARPSTSLIHENGLIQEFKSVGIGSVINLQLPGEHAQCGKGLEPASGFSYKPEDFMEQGVFFYNYGWADYGAPTLTSLLGMVKVMDFALSEGNVAVHCHAGLGRTGVLVACYLVYSRRLSGDQAIAYVRQKRPGSIQSRPQVEMVREFSLFLAPLWTFFPSPTRPLPLQQLLDNQQLVVHGDSNKHLRHMPKVLHEVCVRLVDCCCHTSPSDSFWSDRPASQASELAPPSIQVTDSVTARMEHGGKEQKEEAEFVGVASALAQWCHDVKLSKELEQRLEDIESEVNGCLDWQLLQSENNLICLLHLCSRFLASLKTPVVVVDEDLSWLLQDPKPPKEWIKQCTPSQYLVEKVVETFNMLLKCINDTPTNPHSIAPTSITSLMRGVARRLAMDLCQDISNCANCENTLKKKWGVGSKMSAMTL